MGEMKIKSETGERVERYKKNGVKERKESGVRDRVGRVRQRREWD